MKLISWCFSSKWRFGHPGTRGAATYFSHQRNGRRRKLNQIGSLLTPHLLMIKTRSCTWYFLFSAWKIEIFFRKEISLLNVRNTVNRIEDCIGKGLWHLHENGRGGASCQWKLWPEFSCHTPSPWRLPRHWKSSSSSSRSSSGISVRFLMDCFLWPTICVSDWKQLQLSRVQQMELQQTFVKVFPHTTLEPESAVTVNVDKPLIANASQNSFRPGQQFRRHKHTLDRKCWTSGLTISSFESYHCSPLFVFTFFLLHSPHKYI